MTNEQRLRRLKDSYEGNLSKQVGISCAIKLLMRKERELRKQFCRTSAEIEKLERDVEAEMTNEEWFCSLSTEEKASFLLRIFGNCGWCRDGGNPRFCPTDFENSCLFEGDGLVKWLKEQRHAETETDPDQGR